MIVNKAYKYRIYPNTEQEILIQKTFGCARFVYNHFLEERIVSYQENGKSKSFYEQCKDLTWLKNEYEWLKEPDKNALQQSLKHLDAAYKNFFRNVKIGCVPGFPKFKRKHDNHNSYTTLANGNQVRIEGKFIRLPKLGLVKGKISRKLPEGARILNATVTQEPTKKYFVSIGFEYDLNVPKVEIDKKNSIGLDYSSPHFYVDNNGNKADMPHYYRKAEKKLKIEQEKLSRKVKFSNRWNKQRIRIAKAYEKIRNYRNDWQHKESTRLANEYDLIAVESMDYQETAQKKNLGKATNDNGFGQFRSYLSYKMMERGKKFIMIDKWFSSTKMCHCCGYKNTELTLADREWICPQCGVFHDRDINAAINIREQGMIYAT